MGEVVSPAEPGRRRGVVAACSGLGPSFDGPGGRGEAAGPGAPGEPGAPGVRPTGRAAPGGGLLSRAGPGRGAGAVPGVAGGRLVVAGANADGAPG
ncbi:MAG: hypothetical protein AAGK32_14450, partial [Actinomycetota bacterium]